MRSHGSGLIAIYTKIMPLYKFQNLFTCVAIIVAQLPEYYHFIRRRDFTYLLIDQCNRRRKKKENETVDIISFGFPVFGSVY
jgi:hypothetical protein